MREGKENRKWEKELLFFFKNKGKKTNRMNLTFCAWLP